MYVSYNKHQLNKYVSKETFLIATHSLPGRSVKPTFNVIVIVPMKHLVFFIHLIYTLNTYAQHIPLPHGMVFGERPDTTIIVEATKAIEFMGKKIRVSTTIRGTVVNVVKQKGGWFNLDAGEGKIISAHFKIYEVMLPSALKGRVVIIEGIAVKQTDAKNGQQFGGKFATPKHQAFKKQSPALTFEVSGLMVYK